MGGVEHVGYVLTCILYHHAGVRVCGVMAIKTHLQWCVHALLYIQHSHSHNIPPPRHPHSDVTAASPSAELTALAQSLAQSIIAQDLTALIRAKREAQGGSRTNSPTACDAAGPGAQGALFSGASTPMVGGTPRGGIVHTGAMQAVIGSPHIEPEDSVADPRRCVAQLHVQGGPADLARRVCVLDSLRRLLQGRGGGLLDAGTRQDTLLWLTHEALSGGGVAVAAGGDLWVLPSVKSNPGAVAQVCVGRGGDMWMECEAWTGSLLYYILQYILLYLYACYYALAHTGSTSSCLLTIAAAPSMCAC